MFGEVDPPVDPTLDETTQQPRTPKAEDHPADHLPKTKIQPPADAASLPDSEEKGWVCCVHPEGWIYFVKAHDHEPEDIQLPEICGDLWGEFVTRPTFNSQATNPTSHKPERLGYGGLYVQIYADDKRWYASVDKALLFPQQLTDEKGEDYLV